MISGLALACKPMWLSRICGEMWKMGVAVEIFAGVPIIEMRSEIRAQT